MVTLQLNIQIINVSIRDFKNDIYKVKLKKHSVMNLSHVIDEFSFGDHFPYISQPLDKSVEVNDNRKREYLLERMFIK